MATVSVENAIVQTNTETNGSRSVGSVNSSL